MSSLLEGHTVRRFDGDLNRLHLHALELGGLALDQCRVALAALGTHDAGLARLVLDRKQEVDALKRALDAEVLVLVGRRAPVARDLKVVLAMAKSSADLERIGDAAVKVARFIVRAREAGGRPLAPLMTHDVALMGQLSLGIAETALTALDELDAHEADRVLRRHAELDATFRGCARRVSTFVMETPRLVGDAVNALLLAKALERVGDHARDVAECVKRFCHAESGTAAAGVRVP
jgi:phosphate transport system protein